MVLYLSGEPIVIQDEDINSSDNDTSKEQDRN